MQGDLKNRIDTQELKRIEHNKDPLTGTQVLRLIFEPFQLTKDLMCHYAHQEVGLLQWFGNDHSAVFLDYVDDLYSQLGAG